MTTEQLKFFEVSSGIYSIESSKDVKKIIQEKLISKFRTNTIYQHFDDLGLSRRSSDSPGKFDTISDIDYIGKVCMDIGSNQGYFSFQLWKRGAAEVYGIEACENDFEMAQKYKNCIYQAEKVHFVNKDFFDAQADYSDSSFDVILCFSVFHYFRKRQDEFFDISKRLLKKGGLLLLENGIYQENEEPMIHQYSRSSTEEPCFYPNDKKLRMMANGFEVVSIKASPSQPSDVIPRFVYTLKNI